MKDIEKRLAALEERMKVVPIESSDRRILEGTKVFLEDPSADTAARFLKEIDLAVAPNDPGQVAATVTTVTVTVTITVKAD